MKVDIVILSHGKTPELIATTQNAIDSCLKSESEIEFNIIVIEQGDAEYTGCKVYYDASELNYNKFMNKGIELGDAQYIALCNNDLLFQENWCSIIISVMQKHNLLSACPICPLVQPKKMVLKNDVYFGYRNTYEVCGWCIVINRDILKIIGKLDEGFPFWFADNIYSEQLKKHGINHGVVSKSIVRHLGSQTLNSLSHEDQYNLSHKHVPKFIEQHPKNESAKFFKRNK